MGERPSEEVLCIGAMPDGFLLQLYDVCAVHEVKCGMLIPDSKEEQKRFEEEVAKPAWEAFHKLYYAYALKYHLERT